MEAEFDAFPVALGFYVAAIVVPFGVGLSWWALAPLRGWLRALFAGLSAYGAVALVALAVSWATGTGLTVTFAALLAPVPILLILAALLLRRDARP